MYGSFRFPSRFASQVRIRSLENRRGPIILHRVSTQMGRHDALASGFVMGRTDDIDGGDVSVVSTKALLSKRVVGGHQRPFEFPRHIKVPVSRLPTRDLETHV